MTLLICNDSLVMGDWVHMWYVDSKYCDDDDEDNFFKCYDSYKKRKAQKALFKKELMPIARHPSRYWDWCMSEDEKQETEKLWK